MRNALKRTLAIFLAIVMTIGIAPLSGFVGVKFPEIKLPEWDFIDFSIKTDAVSEGIYIYEVTEGKATITGCDTSARGDILIPSTIGEYPVTSIGSYAFENCKKLVICGPKGCHAEYWAKENNIPFVTE